MFPSITCEHLSFIFCIFIVTVGTFFFFLFVSLCFCCYFTVFVSWPLQGTEFLLSFLLHNFGGFLVAFTQTSCSQFESFSVLSFSYFWNLFERLLFAFASWCFPPTFCSVCFSLIMSFVISTFLSSFSHRICLPVCLPLPTDSWCSGKFPTKWITFSLKDDWLHFSLYLNKI